MVNYSAETSQALESEVYVEDVFMLFRKYCRGMRPHELLDQNILPKAINGLIYQSHTRPSAQKESRQNPKFWWTPISASLPAVCITMQNLPEKVNPCSGPLIKIIILLSACKASSLTSSLKSINENVFQVFQRISMHE